MPATKGAARAGQPGPAARPRAWPAVLAWALFALVLLLFATFLWLDRLVRDAGRPDLALLAPFVVPPSVAALTAGTVGAVLASRRPRHPVGWLLLARGLIMWIGGAAAGYVPYGLIVRPGALPAANVVARIYPVTIAACLAAVGFVLLLTPTGSPPSPRWRGGPGCRRSRWRSRWWRPWSPRGRWTRAPCPSPGRWTPQVYGGALRVANQLALLVGDPDRPGRRRVAGGPLPPRPRGRAPAAQWVALAAALTGLAMLAAAVLIAAGEVNLAAWASVIGVVFLPLATGAAILRYRLYDLDRIISRTLAYGLLDGPARPRLRRRGPGARPAAGRDSSLAVAAATLAVAALFQPARRRVQAAVDRRFNRRRHDAARIIEGFGSPPARPGRPGHPDRRGAGRGRPDHAADPGVAVAAAAGRTGRPAEPGSVAVVVAAA